MEVQNQRETFTRTLTCPMTGLWGDDNFFMVQTRQIDKSIPEIHHDGFFRIDQFQVIGYILDIQS